MLLQNTTPRRRAYTLAEFASMCGKHRSWAYRQVRKGEIKTISGYGTQMIPTHEIERILGEDSTGETEVVP